MIAMVAASDDKKPLTILGIIGLLAVHAGFVFFTIHTFKNSPCYDCDSSNAASNVTSAADTTKYDFKNKRQGGQKRVCSINCTYIFYGSNGAGL